MKKVLFIGLIFALFGMISLVATIIMVQDTLSFIRTSVLTTGEVIDAVTKTTHSSDGETTHSRYAIIRFTDNKNQRVEFETSSSMSSIIIGEKVPVRYAPDNPMQAKLDSSFFDIWGMCLVFGIFAFVFNIIGIPFFLMGFREWLRKRNIPYYTRTIMAGITGIERNTTITVNGVKPYRIVAQWYNEMDQQVYIFKSSNIWFDPSAFIKQENIEVKTDPENAKKYWMDISFLPKKA